MYGEDTKFGERYFVGSTRKPRYHEAHGFSRRRFSRRPIAVDPGVVSGWHHHVDYDVYGYIVSGEARFEGGAAGRDAISVGPGDFFLVPARAVHRDVNPTRVNAQEVILFLRGSGPTVVTVAGPNPT